MIRVGIAGLGFMGRMHFRCWKARADVQIVALCDSVLDPAKLNESSGGNVEGADTLELGDATFYRELDAMLAEAKLDALSITTPSFLHADQATTALAAGVNVLCEKPMALTVADCDRMVEASKKAGKVLQVGHCIRFWPEYAVARDIIAGGKYGKVLGGSFRRAGTMPTWGKWFDDTSRSGGAPLDLHIHDADYIAWVFGKPNAVSAVMDPRESYISAHYRDEEFFVCAEGCWLMTPSFGFEMSFQIMMQEATLRFNGSASQPLQILPREGRRRVPGGRKFRGGTAKSAATAFSRFSVRSASRELSPSSAKRAISA